MLRCPKCGRTFEPSAQKFCTHDGGRLVPDDQAASAQEPTAYDLNQTVRTDEFDPEATVMRTPDLNKTVTSTPTSEIRSRGTGPAPPPPPATPYQPERTTPQPTVAFNQPPPTPPPPSQQQQYYQPTSSAAPTISAHVPPTTAQPQQYAPAQYQQPATSQRKKSGRMPLIIGLVVLVLLGGAAAWYFLVYKKGESAASGNANANANANASANVNSNTSANADVSTLPTPQPTPPPDATEFVNERANLDGKLAENYSDFSFYYPDSWVRDEKTGVAGASNFIRVERRLPPDFTQENFTVSWYESRGTFEADSADVFSKLVESSKSRFAKAYPEFKVLSEGETTVNGQKGYEFRFESVSRGTEKGDITLWGRVIFLPPGVEGKKNGIQLLMLTTSLAPELASANDVGIKGELPVILNSFKMGSK
jgi:hypothetical protein